jgi:hypothetical protein
MRPTYSFIIECIRLVNNEKSATAVACLPAKVCQVLKFDVHLNSFLP